MAKNKRKSGRKSSRDKTAFQDDLRLNKLSNIQNKQKKNLKKSEKKLLDASQAFNRKRGSYSKLGRGGKGGKFFDKNYRINKKQNNMFSNQQSSSSNIFNNFEHTLNTSNNISVSSMIPNKSPTGILSQKAVTSALGGFVKKVKNAAGIKKVDVLKSNNKITGINVKKEFQKTNFKFDPMKLMFKTKGWDLDIPEEYIKKSDTHYVAPKKKFRDIYDKDYDGDDRDRYKTYGHYNPVEVFLNDSGDKLSRVLKRGTYRKSSEKEEDDDRYEYRSNRDVYTTQISDYFGTGLLKRKRNWDDYTIFEKEEERGRDEEEEEERRGIYLKSDLEYNPSGTKKSYKRWDDYYKYEEEEERGFDRDTKEEEEEREGAIYLQRQEEYNDKGKLIRRKTWDDYIKEKEEESSNIEYEEEIERGTFLEKDEFFDNGKLWRRDDYKDVATGFERDSKDKVARFTKTGALKGVSSYGFYKRNKDFLNERVGKENLYSVVDNDGNKLGLQTFDTDKSETKYSTVLDRITYYNPLTGKIINREDYW